MTLETLLELVAQQNKNDSALNDFLTAYGRYNQGYWQELQATEEGLIEGTLPLDECGQYFWKALFVDVDSCLCGIEGIDELARLHGQGTFEEVAQMTAQAMNGKKGYHEIFERRLGIIQPKMEYLGIIARLYQESVVADARTTFEVLRKFGIDIFLVSGGFKEAIEPVAADVGIDKDHMYANQLLFEKGMYAGFDHTNPLCHQGGKKAVIEKIKKSYGFTGPVAIVGDATSELETTDATNLKIGFGGFIQRPAVIGGADLFLATPTPSFAPLVPILLEDFIKDIVNYAPEYREILGRGVAALEHVYFNTRAEQLGSRIKETTARIPKEAYTANWPVLDAWKGS